MSMDEPLVDSFAISKRFGVSVGTVRGWVRDGRIPSIRASRRIVRFRMSDVIAALTDAPQSPTVSTQSDSAAAQSA